MVVLDFAYKDRGQKGLNLSDNDKLLERLYCFKVLEDGGQQRRVILKVHTLLKWRDRYQVKLSNRASKVTAVKVMYAYWNPAPAPEAVAAMQHRKDTDTKAKLGKAAPAPEAIAPSTFVGKKGELLKGMFEIEKQFLKLLPVSEDLQENWRDIYNEAATGPAAREKLYCELEWEWRKKGSMPPPSLEPDKPDGKVKQVYDEVRAAIKLGERVFYRPRRPLWAEVNGPLETSAMLRDGSEVEYEVGYDTGTLNGSEVEYEYEAFLGKEAFLAEDVAGGLQQAWKRPMHWAGFLVMGANTCLPRGGLGRQKKAEEWSVAEVCEMVRGIGFADAAKILEENCIDGKTLCSADFDCFFTMHVGDGGLGLKPMQKARLKKEIDNAT